MILSIKKSVFYEYSMNFFSLLFLWLFLTSTAPWIFFRWPGHPYKLLTFTCLSILTLMLLIRIKEIRFTVSFICVLLLQIFFYLFMFVYHQDSANLNLILQVVSLLITVTYIRFFISIELFVKSYVYILLIMGIGGVICFFIHLLIGITPFFRVEYGNDVSYFLGLTTTNVFIDTGNIRMLRFSGFFDEPGNFGMYALLAIILNKIYFESKRTEILLILVTCLTFSVAFYFSICIYLLFFYFNKKYWHFFFFFFLFVLLVYIGLQYFDSPIIEMVNKMTFSRIEETSADFSNSNRGDLINNDSNIFFNYPLLGAGYSNPIILGSNFFSIFARYGMIGAFFYYLVLFYLLVTLMRYNKFYYFKFFLVILIILVHRPEISNILTLLLLYCFIYFIEDKIAREKFTNFK